MNNLVTPYPSRRALIRVGGRDIQLRKVSTLKDWRAAVAAFVASQDIRQSSRDLYARTLSRFFFWLEENPEKRLQELTLIDLLEYKDALKAASLSDFTISSYLISLRKFYSWLEAEKIYPNIAKGLKSQKRESSDFSKRHLSDAKAAELLRYFKEERTARRIEEEEKDAAASGRSISEEELLSLRKRLEAEALRDYALVNLLLRTGLRTIEASRANIKDIALRGEDAKRVLYIQGKGKDTKRDFVVLTEKAYKPISEYLKTLRRGALAGEPLFSSLGNRNINGALSTRTISGICKEGLRAIGLDSHEYSAHSLRHTAAVSLLHHGGSLRDTQLLLRHASPVTTEIYLKSAEEEDRLSGAAYLLDAAF